MHRYIEKKAKRVKEKIEEVIKKNLSEIEDCFNYFLNDKELNFIKYYNSTVLEGMKIDFGEFSKQWGLRLRKAFYADFDKERDKRINEIREKEDIVDFYISYCIPKKGNIQHSFCSKLFHTILPDKFPPVDSNLRNVFKLQNESYILSILIIKKAYEDYIRDNKDKINEIQGILRKFELLQIDKISDIRVIDMFYRCYANNKSTKKSRYFEKEGANLDKQRGL